MKKVYNIEVDCAICAQKCEDAIKKVEGVIDCQINFITQKMVFEAEDKSFDKTLKLAIKAARKIEDEFEVEM